MTLMEGDVILTGTPPDGVGPVRVGQKIKAGITDLIDVEFDVQRRKRPFSNWCSKQEAMATTLSLFCISHVVLPDLIFMQENKLLRLDAN